MHTIIYKPFYVYAWKFHHLLHKYSRFKYVHRKSNALNTLIEFKVGSYNLLSKHISYFDYIEEICLVHLIFSECMRLHPSLLHLELHYRVMERRYQTLIGMVRSVIGFSLLSIFFFGYVLNTVEYLFF